MTKLKTVAVYLDQSELVVARSFLDSQGIWTTVPEWYHAANAWHFTMALQGISLCVMDFDEARAKTLLKKTSVVSPRLIQFSIINFCIVLFSILVLGLPYAVRSQKKSINKE